jgi:hypothetical protein
MTQTRTSVFCGKARVEVEVSENPVSRELDHFKLAAVSNRIHFADTPNPFAHTRA